MLIDSDFTAGAQALKENGVVIIIGHDVDDHLFLPLSTRRDFGIKEMSTYFVTPSDSIDLGGSQATINELAKIPAGLRFTSFMGRKVDGYYTTTLALLIDGLLSSYSPERGMIIIQLVPEFAGYRKLCNLLGKIHRNDQLTARALWTDEALAQHVSEVSLINICGIIGGMTHLRNNPIAPMAGKSLREHVMKHKLLVDVSIMWKFLAEIGCSYGVLKLDLSYMALAVHSMDSGGTMDGAGPARIANGNRKFS